MKHWTERQASSQNTLSPDAINREMQASQSSITTISREQAPANFLDTSRLQDYALHRVWQNAQWPQTAGFEGQQDADRDTKVQDRMWESSTIQVHAGGWTDVSTPVLLSGFKGGSFYAEYGANVYVYQGNCKGLSEGSPFSPAYMRMRILANGTTVAETRGKAGHGRHRIFGTAFLPPGDLVLSIQFRLTEQSADAAAFTNALAPDNHLMLAHIYSGRYLAIGRWR